MGSVGMGSLVRQVGDEPGTILMSGLQFVSADDALQQSLHVFAGPAEALVAEVR